MSDRSFLEIFQEPNAIVNLVRIVAVIALVVIAAALATPKGRVPLALRGLMRIMKKDRTASAPAGGSGTLGDAAAGGAGGTVPLWKRLLAFVLVILAFALAIIIV